MIPILSHTQKNVLSPDYFLFFQVEHLIAVDDSYFLRMFSFFQTIFTHSNKKFFVSSLIRSISRKSLLLRHPAALRGSLYGSCLWLLPSGGVPTRWVSVIFLQPGQCSHSLHPVHSSSTSLSQLAFLVKLHWTRYYCGHTAACCPWMRFGVRTQFSKWFWLLRMTGVCNYDL